MTDIAKLGFSVETTDLEDAIVKLNKIKPAAQGASSAANALEKSLTQASKAQRQAALEAARAEEQKARRTLASLRASGTATKAEIEAARATQLRSRETIEIIKELNQKAKATIAAAKADRVAADATDAATVALRKNNSELNAVAAGVGGRGGGVSGGRRGGVVGVANDQLPNRFNTANIAAQFQDIGVTAAAGQAPLTIALQQGTQLSAILNSMENPLRGIAAAFTSIINPVSLLSIGLVALIAAGLQVLDWGNILSSVLNGLADAIEYTTPFVLSLGAALTVLYSPAIITGIRTVIASIVAMGVQALAAGAKIAAAWVIANPVTAIAAAIAAISGLVGAVLLSFAKTNETVRNSVNTIIGFFYGLFQSAVEIFRLVGKATADLFLSAWTGMLNILAGLLNATLIKPLNYALEKLGKDTIDLLDTDYKSPFADWESDALAMGDTLKKIMREAGEKDFVGGIEAGIDNVTGKIRAFADKIKFGGDAEKEADKYRKIVEGAERRVATLEAEREALFLTEQEAEKLRIETGLLNQAQQQGITLTAQQRTELAGLAGTLAQTQLEIDRTKEALEFAKTTSKGFFDDLSNGIREGKGLWESFGDAVVNALNRIADKMLELAFDDLFTGLASPSVSGGSGGFLGSIAGFLFSAKGNAFDQSGVQPFAKGGAFTNSVVNQPTLFTFANGGSFGMMGEAGPEAIMPLQRGSDGSLGVKVVSGVNDGGNVQVNIFNNSGATATQQSRQTSNGTEIDVYIDDLVAEKIGSQGTASNRALQESNNRQLIRRK